MLKTIALAAALSACTMSHNAALEMRYTGAVLLVGDALVTTEPLLNGEGSLQKQTTTIGTSIGLVGIALIVWSLVGDESKR